MVRLSLFGLSLLFCSISLGCLNEASNPRQALAEPKQAPYTLVDSKTLEFGSAPQDYNRELSNLLASDPQGFEKQSGWSYETDGAYRIGTDDKGQKHIYPVPCHTNSEGNSYYLQSEANRDLTTGNLVGTIGVFDYAPMHWRILEEDSSSYRVIPVTPYYKGPASYSSDPIFAADCELVVKTGAYFFDAGHKASYFTQEQVDLIVRDKNGNISIDLPRGELGSSGVDVAVSGSTRVTAEHTTDYMALTGLNIKEGGITQPLVWIVAPSTNHIRVLADGKWYVDESNYSLDDDSIGVMPIISIKKVSSGGGSTSPSNPSKPAANVNGLLIFSIIAGVAGVGALIAFIILLWKKHKNDPSFKAPKWFYAIMFIATAFCMVFAITLPISTAGGGGGCPLKMGIYVQYDEKSSGKTGGISWVQAGYTAFVIREDGTGGYCLSLEDGENASDFEEHVDKCTWTVSGSSFKLSHGGNYAFTLTGKVGCGIITGTNGNYSYRWVREA